MKILMTVLAVVMTASTAIAQDTLIVRSFQTVDVCSGAKRYTIAPYLGRIRSTDSLMSFDISINFDPTVTGPTDLLTMNTLSANLDFPPVMNTAVPGEIRVAGFNVLRPMNGDLPLFAVAGTFKGGCGSFDVPSITWPPSFNEEFKKMVTIFTWDTIQSKATPLTRSTAGTQFETNTVNIRPEADSAILNATVLLEKQKGVQFRYVARIADTTVAQFSGITITNAILNAPAVVKPEMIEVLAETDTESDVTITFSVRKRSSSATDTTTITANVEVFDSCLCWKPGLKDTLEIVTENTITSINSTVDDNSDNITIIDNRVMCYCPHGQLKDLKVFNVQSQLLRSVAEGINGTQAQMEIGDLPHGVYLVVSQCGRGVQIRKTLK